MGYRKVSNDKEEKFRRPNNEDQVHSQGVSRQSNLSSLYFLQDQLGNRTIQRLIAQRSHEGSIKLDEETIASLQLEGNPMVPELTQVAGGVGPQLHRQLIAESIQRQEEAEAEPQAEPQARPTDGDVCIEDVNFEYYDVRGSTLAQVAPQLDPQEWGRCTYHFDYTYETTNGRVSRVDITLRLTVRLPRWQGQGWDNASPHVKQEWQRMLEALQGHEEEHAEIARRWAPVFKERLLNLRAGRVGQRYNQLLKKVDKETKEFDQRTRHGRTQGVTLDKSIE